MAKNTIKMDSSTDQIQPLFILSDAPEKMGDSIIEFMGNDYNKKFAASLIDAKNDADAISTFLREYKDSPETLRSYAIEIERLLLWCIHIKQTIWRLGKA